MVGFCINHIWIKRYGNSILTVELHAVKKPFNQCTNSVRKANRRQAILKPSLIFLVNSKA